MLWEGRTRAMTMEGGTGTEYSRGGGKEMGGRETGQVQKGQGNLCRLIKCLQF